MAIKLFGCFYDVNPSWVISCQVGCFKDMSTRVVLYQLNNDVSLQSF